MRKAQKARLLTYAEGLRARLASEAAVREQLGAPPSKKDAALASFLDQIIPTLRTRVMPEEERRRRAEITAHARAVRDAKYTEEERRAQLDAARDKRWRKTP